MLGLLLLLVMVMEAALCGGAWGMPGPLHRAQWLAAGTCVLRLEQGQGGRATGAHGVGDSDCRGGLHTHGRFTVLQLRVQALVVVLLLLWLPLLLLLLMEVQEGRGVTGSQHVAHMAGGASVGTGPRSCGRSWRTGGRAQAKARRGLVSSMYQARYTACDKRPTLDLASYKLLSHTRPSLCSLVWMPRLDGPHPNCPIPWLEGFNCSRPSHLPCLVGLQTAHQCPLSQKSCKQPTSVPCLKKAASNPPMSPVSAKPQTAHACCLSY